MVHIEYRQVIALISCMECVWSSRGGGIFVIFFHVVSLIFVFRLWVHLFYFQDEYLQPNLAGQESDSCTCRIQQFGIKLWLIQMPRCKFKCRKILRTEPVLF